ncbi:hypothetical protein [Candidatus Protochlamydia phocaeensis]|uniref:hypothetical protein n=1 Tax=Candidatus Protochlamydia phocaeensis TaxID=1414722 RepID=UPI000838CC3B|nr:hypothetical protein [Candidatus Protochlamydia phocaeensis]
MPNALNKQLRLEKCLRSIPQAPYPFQSRVHPLKSFHFPSLSCFVKREDELGFGISGSKIRKYRTLIPFLLAEEIKEVVIVGSAYSNHVLGITQLLLENGLVPTLFVRGNPRRELTGNAFLSTLLVPPSSIHWFSKQDWASAEEQAHLYAQKRPHKAFVLPEGGCLTASLPGALTLPLDILRNEQERDLSFDHLFIDSGTGLTAIALILAYSWLEKPAQIHVVLMADTSAYFLDQLSHFHAHFLHLMQIEEMPLLHNFHLYYPQKTPRFGQINQSLFQDIIGLARLEGFLTDPVYTIKLFREAKRIIGEQSLQGNALILHSGGALTLMGFEEQLKAALNESYSQNGH